MIPVQHIARALRRFAHQAEGSLSVEAAIMAPLLLGVYAASFVYFDLFAEKNVSVKAAYTVADLVSREVDPVDADYVDRLGDVFDYLVPTGTASEIRVTSIRCTANCDGGSDRQLTAVWSHGTGDEAPLCNKDLPDYEPRVPRMALGDSVLMVETFSPYVPAFNVGIDAGTFANLVFTRPRFVPRIKYKGTSKNCAAVGGAV